MRDFAGRVAVVTGGASGIGRALGRRFAAARMKVVLGDVEEAALEAAVKDLESEGAEALGVPTDVTRSGDVDALAHRALDRFGAVHVVCNNAGVFTAGLAWESSIADYEWVLGVNVWGVIHGVRTFVPILLEQDTESHLVNTASMAGLTSLPTAAAYHMSKHAVLALSEVLYRELADSRVGVSALCPEMVATRIGDAERNRPERLRNPLGAVPSSEPVRRGLQAAIASGLPPEALAERTFEAIRERRFYILAEDAWRDACNARLDDIRAGRNPTRVRVPA